MRVMTYSDPKAFLTRAEAFCESDPFSPSVIATVTTRIASRALSNGEDNVWFTVESDDAQVIGVAMHTPPYNMFVSLMTENAAIFLAHEVAESGRNLPGVNGAVASTQSFARGWQERTGRNSTVVTKERMYRLVELRSPEGVSGQDHLGMPGDLELVARWLASFHDEAQPQAPVDDWTEVAERRMNVREIHLWRSESETVALAGISQAVAGVARVGPVYTPPRWRGRGFGSSVTAAATSAGLLAGAQHVILYTDLANPTSNSIYQNIGFRPHHDAEERTFGNEWVG